MIHTGEVPNHCVLTSPCVCSNEDVAVFNDTDDILLPNLLDWVMLSFLYKWIDDLI